MTTTTAKRIQVAAIDLFGRKGYEATGIRDLAHAAGVSTATLYHHIGTKQDLLVEVMAGGLGRVLAAGRLAVAGIAEPEVSLSALVQIHVIIHGRFQASSTMFDYELRSLTPTNAISINALRSEYEDLWRASIERGRQSGIFNTTEPTLARLGILEMCTGVARWYSPGRKLELPEVSLHFADMALSLLEARRDGRPLKVSELDLPEATHLWKIVDEIWEGAPTID